ncbi:hypothetical protein [Litchfieldia alkalitelluris]|uniref:hypothetical protein n=1 Tax=Litchfieldia alkalitelluris TaxID=304268 RepID=UPI001473691C|nr:hypothetical protein [Litchfieldia alkalitelluris]
MKKLIALISMLVILTACGQPQLKESMTLLNQQKEEVTFPQEKPTLFFFITTYT